jgi:Uncharacterized conserved protein
MKKYWIYIVLICLALFSSCREDEFIDKPDPIEVGLPEYTSIQGFYLLNEGQMGTNKSSLDYYDYETGVYTRNIYPSANPEIARGLGDVGNDLKIYGDRLYAVINCSNLIEIMDKHTAKHIESVSIPNCRYIRFHGKYAYVTSYAGPVQSGNNNSQLGFVAKIDTASLEIIDRCEVGYQPDELEIIGQKLYVANSGGYLSPNYEKTVSVIDLNTFTVEKEIPVAINLHHLRKDRYAQLWVSSRGDYYGTSSKLYCIDTQQDIVIDSLDIAVSNFHLDGDSLYICSTEFNYSTMQNEITYGIVHVKHRRLVSENFIKDGTERRIINPYGLTVNPITKDIYVSDSGNNVYTGTVYCFDKDGNKKWEMQTGVIPAHFTFLGELDD